MRSRSRRRGFGLRRMERVAGELTETIIDDTRPIPPCATCGTPLLGIDPEDGPDGDAGPPICGECNRAGNIDAEAG